MQEKLESIRQNLQFIDLNNKMETFDQLKKLTHEVVSDTRIKEQVDCHIRVHRLENSCQCSAWKTQKSSPLGLVSERLPIDWVQDECTI